MIIAFTFVLNLLGSSTDAFVGCGTTTPVDTFRHGFSVYWNVPTFMCHKYGMHFEEVSRDFGMLQNPNDQFRGEQIAILYDPGMFPALLKDKNGRVIRRNGGVPQEGNLTRHLEMFRKQLNEQIPNENFSGIAVIDFESWRPIFRQNWASLQPYKDLSISLVRKKHPYWNKRNVEQEAVRVFEKHGRLFMEETLKTAKRLRPRAKWGYYAYPYCYNLTPPQCTAKCEHKTVIENDRMSWLFNLEDVLFPSVYMKQKLSKSEKVNLVEGRIEEARRISRRSKSRPQILPYYWYKYTDHRDVYLSNTDLESTVKKISDLGTDGFIIWGSSEDVDSQSKCQRLKDYLTNVLGPAVNRVRSLNAQRSVDNENSADNLVEQA